MNIALAGSCCLPDEDNRRLYENVDDDADADENEDQQSETAINQAKPINQRQKGVINQPPCGD